MRERNKHSKGITLIALVITIIVLIILAGISISMLTGQNGILQQAGKAKQETETASEVEKIKLSFLSALTVENGNYLSSNFERELNNNLKNNLGENEYELKCYKADDTYEITLSKGTIYCISSSGEVQTKGNAKDIKAVDYGKYVNYGVNYVATESNKSNKWEIFYADENNVYLISQGNVGNLPLIKYIENYTNSNMLTDSKRFPMAHKWLSGMKDPDTKEWYLSTADCMKGVLYLLDSTGVWNDKYKNNYASYAVGAPTLELLCSSYDDVNGEGSNTKELATTVLKQERNSEGIVINQWYGYTNLLQFDITKSTSNGRKLWNEETFDYWLASTHDKGTLRVIKKDRDVVVSAPYSNYDYYGIRPVVCLKPTVKLTWNEKDQMYDLN